MADPGYIGIVGASLVLAACGGPSAGPREPTPPLPPEAPEPVLVENGMVFAYAVDGEVLADLDGPGTIAHELTVDKVRISLRSPSGWTSTYAGAVWLESQEDSRVRFVVYFAEDHEHSFRTYWYQGDAADQATTVSEIHSLGSARQPFLYTYCRSDDGRCGIVYALLAEPGRAASGILVHGVWPASYDRRLLPIVAAAANGVRLGSL